MGVQHWQFPAEECPVRLDFGPRPNLGLSILLSEMLRPKLAVLLSSRPGLGLEDPRGHLMKVLALALDDKVLALTPQVLALALREKSSPKPRLFPQDPGHVVAVRVCSSAHTHGVT